MGGLIQTIDSYQRIALDTSVFIYAFEQHPTYELPSSEILRRIQNGSKSGVISVLTVAELMVGPYPNNNRKLAQLYEARISIFPNLQVIDVRRPTVRDASRIRGDYGFDLPDVIHLATALQHGADAFITNDRRLQRFQELPVALLTDFVH